MRFLPDVVLRMQKWSASILVSGAVAASGIAVPSMARADGELAKAIIAGIIFCGATGACDKKTKRTGGKSKNYRAGPVDAGSMDQSERMLIQQALARLGYYSGTIDGSFGAGTRASIRAYQTAIGAPVTGVLTGSEVNALMAASPKYAAYGPGDPMLFEADLAVDLTNEEIKAVQAKLNALGFDAGPVDGDMGGRTRAAIAAYKAAKLLPGDPIPTRRLLAHLGGGTPPAVLAAGAAGAAVPLAAADDYQKAGAVAPVEVAAAETDEAPVTPIVSPASVLNFELVGLRIGMTDADIQDIVADYLDTEIVTKSGVAADFGGDELLSMGQMLTQASWPAPPAEQIVAFYDEAVPELGALAIFRSVLLPPSVTHEVFETELLAQMIDTYGREGLVEGALVWIGDASAREAARMSASALAGCGGMKLAGIDSMTAGADVGWSTGTGTTLDPALLGSVISKCGDVLIVTFEPGLLSFGLWNSDLIVERRAAMAGGDAAAVVPALKF